ncbi:hypothetical protein [Paenibacillus chitinolyticus]|uniref:hypothetical protein n=1 Tax=Paenibacillus chitinolyticus TaxID=79263 RepID=UPI00364A4EE9
MQKRAAGWQAISLSFRRCPGCIKDAASAADWGNGTVSAMKAKEDIEGDDDLPE